MDNLAKAVGANFRDKDQLVKGVSRHLMKGVESDRRTDCVHPSEAASETWCPRATYYRISGAEAEPEPRWLAMEMVFERGNDAHEKWQTWFREMGKLRGDWECRLCLLRWTAVSPTECPRCESGADLIRYREVPLSAPHYLLAGQADGDVLTDDGSTLIEVKTVGEGTLRYDAPKVIEKYQYTHIDEEGKKHSAVDWPSLWRGIHRPFGSHLRQGMLYCFMADRKEIVFIYDPKFITAYPKEFEVKFRRDLIEDVLDQCLVIKRALDKERAPKRPLWADKSTTCKKCVYRKTCYGSQSKLDGTTVQESDSGKGRAEEEQPSSPPKAKIRFTTPAIGTY